MARTTRAAATASGSTTTKTKEKPKESATSSKTATKGKQSKSKAKAAETEDDDNDDHDDEEETTTTDGIPTLLLPKGQTQTTDALLKKLQALHAYLNSWVQHEDEEAFAEKHDLKSQKSPINIARRHLVDNSILLHKNQGVKAYAACCISDVLRLYAPDAPYREDELRDIFQFFVKQLSIGLRGTSSESTPYFDQYYHLLESLSTVKSVVLICDLPNSEELTTEFFREFFLLAAGGKHGQFQGGVVQTNRKLIHYMGDILVAIIDESTSIPGEVTELILAQFMQQQPQNSAPTPSIRLASYITSETADKLSRYFATAFADMVTSASSSSHNRSNLPDSDDEEEDKESTKGYEDLKRAHLLLQRLWYYTMTSGASGVGVQQAVALVQATIPQVEEQLRTEDPQVRMIAMSTWCTLLFGGSDQKTPNLTSANPAPALIRAYPSAHKSVMLRATDRSSAVRVKWCDVVGRLALTDGTMRSEILELLLHRMLDSDTPVRLAATRVFAGVQSFADIMGLCAYRPADGEDGAILNAISARAVDRKPNVRAEALSVLGKWYDLGYKALHPRSRAPVLADTIKAFDSYLSTIPHTLLSMLTTSNELRSAIEACVWEKILPLPNFEKEKGKEKEKEPSFSESDIEREWTNRLLFVLLNIGTADKKDGKDKAKNLLNMSGIKGARPNAYDFFIEACIKYNGGLIDDAAEEAATKARLDNIIRFLATTFPEPTKATEHLHTFAKLNEPRLFKLFKTIIDPNIDLKTLTKAWGEFLKRLHSHSHGNKGGDSTLNPHTGMAGSVIALARRASVGMVNVSSIPTLLEAVCSHSTPAEPQSQTQDTQRARRISDASIITARQTAIHAKIILETISKNCPKFFSTHVGSLVEILVDAEGLAGDLEDDSDADMPIQVALNALAALVRVDPSISSKLQSFVPGGDADSETDDESDSRMNIQRDARRHDKAQRAKAKGKGKARESSKVDILDIVKKHVLGPNRRCAKFAARYLAFAYGSSKDGLCGPVVEQILNSLPTFTSSENYPLLGGHVTALTQLARFAPSVIEEQSEDVVRVVVGGLLMGKKGKHKSRETQDYNDEDEDGEEWAEDNELSGLTHGRLQAIKMCRWRCLNLANGPRGDNANAQDEAIEVATPVIRMLVTCLEQGGSLDPSVREDLKVRCRLRLQSAVSLLHLATVERFAMGIQPRFMRVALQVQDTCFDTRLIFVTKTIALLTPRKLPAQYNLIPLLTAHDPEKDVKALANAYIRNSVRRMSPDQRLQNLELIFTRLIHILAHHPDFEGNHSEVVDTAEYISQYLDFVATADNISLLHHLAMKCKTVRDSDPKFPNENLYMLSELAQELIVAYARDKGWTLTTWPGKVKMPTDIFRPLATAGESSEIIKTTYLPQETISWLADRGKPVVKEKKERTKRKAVSAAKTNGQAKRPRKKRRASGADSDEDDDEGGAGAEPSDVEMEDGEGDVAMDDQDGEDDEEEGGEEKLGRGGKRRAKTKTRAKRKARSS